MATTQGSILFSRLIGNDKADEIKATAWGDFNQLLIFGTTSSAKSGDQAGKNGWFTWLNYDL